MKYKQRRIFTYQVNRKVKSVGVYMWAKPYSDDIIESIDTGQKGSYRYSPLFKSCIADTKIELTGYRKKDYIIAEKKTGVSHTPNITVWHHVWEEKNGLYRMQLVDFEIHRKTCPHAGGCKLWTLNMNKKSKYLSYRVDAKKGEYLDIAGFYPIEASKRNYYQSGYVRKNILSKVKRKGLKLIGMDMYGNLYYQNPNRSIYFWNHEDSTLSLIYNRKGKACMTY